MVVVVVVVVVAAVVAQHTTCRSTTSVHLVDVFRKPRGKSLLKSQGSLVPERYGLQLIQPPKVFMEE